MRNKLYARFMSTVYYIESLRFELFFNIDSQIESVHQPFGHHDEVYVAPDGARSSSLPPSGNIAKPNIFCLYLELFNY
jgi:hypothetical protein